MTDPAYATVDGREAIAVRLLVGYAGPWQAWVQLGDEGALPQPPERVTIRLGDLALVGVVAPDDDGTQGLQRFTRIVGGGGGWGASVERRGYHNDAGVKARLIADDVAREVDETIGTFEPAATRVGFDYARQAGVASTALSDAIGPGVAWWVGYDGVTNVGARPVTTPNATSYQVLSFDPREDMADVQVDDASTLVIGSTLTTGLDAPGVVREFELTCEGGSALKISAWLGGSAQQPGRLAGLVGQLVRRVVSDRLYGIYRYRVATMHPGDGRVDLQAISAGVPDLNLITPWPGVPGAHGNIAPGSEVLVQFVDGSRASPVVTAYAPYGSDSFVPTSLVLGGNTGEPAARLGDAVEVLLPPMVFVGTINGLPATGTVSATLPKAIGKITAGSGIVSIA
jgi:hypothetical protein